MNKNNYKKLREEFLKSNNIFDIIKILIAKQDIFEDIIASDIAGDEYKPSPNIYHIANHEFKIKDTDTVYFFEDSLENIRAGKKFYKWNGVLIDPKRTRKPKTVDYMFKTIEDAIIFFIAKEKFD